MAKHSLQSTVPIDQPAPLTFHERKPVRGSLIWWLRWLGIVAFLIVLWQLPQSNAMQLAHLDLRWLGVCMLLTLSQLLLEALVWRWLIATQRIRYPYPKTLLTYLASQYLGLVTPGHVGEFLAAGYVSLDTGITFGYALSSVVIKKLLAWVTIMGFGLWSLRLLVEVPLLQGVKQVALMSVVALTFLSLGIALWVVSLRHLAKKWQRLSPWQVDMADFWAGIRSLATPHLIMPLMISAVAFSVLFLQFQTILWALGISLPILLVAKMVALSRILARFVPVSFVGFGSKDAAMIWLLAQQNIDPAIGFTATVLFLVCSYLVTLLLSGLCWWIKPLVIRRVAPSSS